MEHPNRLDVRQLETLRTRDDVLLLDVRTPAEFSTAHIPGSVNVPLALIERHPERIAAEISGPTVLLCRSGARSERAEQELARQGVTDLSVAVGGFEAWQKAGGEPTRGATRWDLERQVRLVAGSLALTGVVASTVVPRAKWLSGAIGAGLTTAAVTNTCAMGRALSKLPYNQNSEVSLHEATRRLRAA